MGRLFVVLAIAAAFLNTGFAADDEFTGVGRVVVVGDLHGDYEQSVAVLRSAGVIGAELDWTGGTTHLVQTGDALDRGPDPRKVIELLMKLERQAKKAGGRVHALIGNHEAMNVYGDLRYVSEAAFAGFAKTVEPASDGKPAGYDEYRRMFASDGKYGAWIRKHNAVIRIDDTVFMHGGIGPKYAGLSIREINERVREELVDIAKLETGLAKDPEGPLWYRGMARGNEEQLMPTLDAVLANWKARRMVIGHTFADSAITPRFGGKVLMIDVGLSRLYDPQAHLACLVIENGKPYALHRAKRLELPTDSGPDLLRYLKEAAALDPPPSALLPHIQALEKQLAAGAATAH